jgi:hypothetical protein
VLPLLLPLVLLLVLPWCTAGAPLFCAIRSGLLMLPLVPAMVLLLVLPRVLPLVLRYLARLGAALELVTLVFVPPFGEIRSKQ